MLAFVTLLLAAIDFSRWIYAIDASQEAAREGARVAAVCNLNAAAISSRVQIAMRTATAGTTTVAYTPGGCCANEATCLPACTGVTVTLSGYRVPRIAPFMPTMNLPAVVTYLPRESLNSTSNPRCS